MEDFADVVAAGMASPPRFPTLRVTAPTSNDEWAEKLPNTAPFKVDNEFFEGKVLVLLRTQKKEQDPTYAPFFEGKRRLLEVQMQVSPAES